MNIQTSHSVKGWKAVDKVTGAFAVSTFDEGEKVAVSRLKSMSAVDLSNNDEVGIQSEKKPDSTAKVGKKKG